MKINVMTTINYDKEIITEEDLVEIYSIFRDIIKNTYESKDLTDFSFVNSETMLEIEQEVVQNGT